MTNRSVLNIRPDNAPGAMPYSPQRDLVNIFSPMLREVFEGLDAVKWEAYFKGWLEAEGVTEDQFSEGIKCFVEAMRLFIRDREVDHPYKAFEKAGFYQLPNPIRVLLFERIGEVITGGFFVAIRDVTTQGMPSPAQADMCAMIAAGRAMAATLSTHRPRQRSQVEHLEFEIERLNAEVQETARANEQMNREYDRVVREKADMADKLHKQGLQTAVANRLLGESFPSRFFTCLSMLWTGKLPETE